MKIFYRVILIQLLFSLILGAQISKEPYKKLEFIVGEWESNSINHISGKKIEGKSSIKWILGKTWLQWKFTAQLEKGPIEVLTLINFSEEKRKYAFYSFNPFDDHPLPHFGDWISPEILRLEIEEKEGKTIVDIIVRKDGNFDQIHSRIKPTGEKIKRMTTRYSKIKSL